MLLKLDKFSGLGIIKCQPVQLVLVNFYKGELYEYCDVTR